MPPLTDRERDHRLVGEQSGRAVNPAGPDKTPKLGLPKSALWLGGSGVIPFVCLSLAIPFANGTLRPQLQFALMAYGAAILSFLGGIRWGVAIAEAARTEDWLLRRLGLSVMPSLVAWASLLMPAKLGCLTLVIGLTAMWLLDILASRAGELPSWYPGLRWPLTCVAVASLVTGFI